MQLMRIGAPGAEKPGARLDDATYADLSDVVGNFDETCFGGGGLDRIRPVVAERASAGRVAGFAGERIGAPIARPHQILCIRLNHRNHAAEAGMPVQRGGQWAKGKSAETFNPAGPWRQRVRAPR